MPVPEPEVTYRSWAYVWTRPRRMGWPTMVKRGAARLSIKDSRITPKRIIVNVSQERGHDPVLDLVRVDGVWTGTPYEVKGEKIRFDANPVAIGVYAPDWVRELADEAVRLARAEVGRAYERS